MKNKLLTLAGALLLLAVLGHFYAKPLLAQVRAALVKNIDEQGRSPYHATVTCPTGGVNEGGTANCSDQTSVMVAVIPVTLV